MNFLPYDWVALGYLVLTGVLILIFHKNVARWHLYLLVRVCCIIGIVSLVHLKASMPFPLQFLRDWLPIIHHRTFLSRDGQINTDGIPTLFR